MDTGEGKFIPFELMSDEPKLQKKHPNHGGTFHKGEELTIKGSKFRVTLITPMTLRLKLLKR